MNSVQVSVFLLMPLLGCHIGQVVRTEVTRRPAKDVDTP